MCVGCLVVDIHPQAAYHHKLPHNYQHLVKTPEDCVKEALKSKHFS